MFKVNSTLIKFLNFELEIDSTFKKSNLFWNRLDSKELKYLYEFV